MGLIKYKDSKKKERALTLSPLHYERNKQLYESTNIVN